MLVRSLGPAVAADAFGNALGDSIAGSMKPQTQGVGPWSDEDYRNESDIASDNAATAEQQRRDALYGLGGRRARLGQAAGSAQEDWSREVDAGIKDKSRAWANWDDVSRKVMAQDAAAAQAAERVALREQNARADVYVRELKMQEAANSGGISRDGITAKDLAVLGAAFDRRDTALAAARNFVGPQPSYVGSGEMQALPERSLGAQLMADLVGKPAAFVRQAWGDAPVNPFTNEVVNFNGADRKLEAILGVVPLPFGKVGQGMRVADEVAAVSQAAIRARVEANLAESAAARGASRFNDPVSGLVRSEWPPYPGTVGQVEGDFTLLPGALVDRFGPPRGTFLSPVGTTYGERALKPGTMRDDYYVYEVQRPLTVKVGEVRSWFGEMGNGTQYRLDPIDGARRSPSTLTTGDSPYLKELYRGKYWEYRGR